jgi:hypothetical protein
MKAIALGVCALGLLLLSGCSHTYSTRRISEEAPAKLAPAATAYVALPAAATFEELTYAESGKQTAGVIASALAEHVANVASGESVEALEQALGSAKTGGLEYVFFAELVQWEDRITAWSGRSDKLVVRISVYRVGDGARIDAVEISGTSKWFTFGGDHPQDLLLVPVDEFVAGLF